MVRGIGFLSSRNLPTPFGKIELPSFEIPRRGPPQMDERRKKAVKHAMACDLTMLVGLAIPYVGGFIGGQISDLHGAEMRKILTAQEMDKYVEADKRFPTTTLPLLYSFVR